MPELTLNNNHSLWKLMAGFPKSFLLSKVTLEKRQNIRKSKYIMTVAKNQNKMIKALNKRVWVLRANRVELCFPVIVYAL